MIQRYIALVAILLGILFAIGIGVSNQAFAQIRPLDGQPNSNKTVDRR